MDLRKIGISELSTLLVESRTERNRYAKRYHTMNEMCSDIEDEISKRRLDIVDIKVGDVIEINANHYVSCGVYVFDCHESSIKVTRITKKFISGRLINGGLYKEDGTPVRGNEFMVSKRNFLDVVYNLTNLGDFIDRELAITELLKE